MSKKDQSRKSTDPKSSNSRGRMYFFHCSIITLLYFCQGLSQGCLSVIPLLLLRRFPQLSLSSQATLHLPVYAFSLKFLWSPLVDRLYFQLFRIHRRAQWVAPLQLLMALGYFILVLYGTESILSATKTTEGFNRLFMLLCLLSVSSATQDIAVDAWAVEGLPASECGTAGTLQLVGLLGGIFCSNTFLQLLLLYPKYLTLELFFTFCGICCLIALVLAVALALSVSLPVGKNVDGTSDDTLSFDQLVKKLLRHAPLRDTIIVLITRGWPLGLDALILSRLLSIGVLGAADVARYKMYDTVIQVAIGSIFAERVLRHFHPAMVQRLISYISMCMVLLNVFAYMICLGSSSSENPFPPWFVPGVVLPQILLGSLVHSVNFVAQVTIFSYSAKQIPAYTGVVITLLNALANLGMNIPSTVCLYMGSFIENFGSASKSFAGKQGENTTQSNKSLYTVDKASLDVLVCAIIFIGGSFVLWKRYLVQATYRLEQSIIVTEEIAVPVSKQE